MTRHSPVPLARLNFPPYVAAVIDDRHVLVAGGGGAVKTGVANKLEIFEVNRANCQAERVTSIDTASTALMNATVFEFEDRTFIAAGGIGGMCQIFSAHLTIDCDIRINGASQRNGSPVIPDSHQNNGSTHLRRRNSSSSSRESVPNGHFQTSGTVSEAVVDDERRLTFDVQPFATFKCDFNENEKSKNDDSFLKTVKFCNKANFLLTGGSDGHVRFWNFPSLTKAIDLSAHTGEIVDLDVDATSESIVTIASDGTCRRWRMRNGDKISDLEYVIPVAKNATRPVKYKFKGCRFFPSPEAPHVLFTSLVPAAWSKTPEPCYLCRWDVRTCLNDRRIVIGTDTPSHMSISSGGDCLAIGTLTGAVSVYNSFSMSKLYQIENCHRSFVTRVEFLKAHLDAEIESKSSEHLISISVDNQIFLHTIRLQESSGVLGSPLIFVATLVFVYLMALLIGL